MKGADAGTGIGELLLPGGLMKEANLVTQLRNFGLALHERVQRKGAINALSLVLNYCTQAGKTCTFPTDQLIRISTITLMLASEGPKCLISQDQVLSLSRRALTSIDC